MDLSKLNDKQREAVLHTEGPLLLLAGAGSGKTNVLTHRIAYIISKGVLPFNILAITFTNKAAKEMKNRVSALTKEGEDVWVSTFHSMCVRILRQEIMRLGYDRSFSIYDTDDCERVMKNIIKELNVNDKQYPYKSVLHEIGRAKDELVSPEIYEKNVASDYRKSVYAKLYTAYQKKLKDSNSLDFDDIIFKTVEIFNKFPDVLEKYRRRFKYISVDEYQDTNFAQYELVRLLSEKYRNLCVVGDDDQSIYGWRGADIRNILDFEKDYPDAKVIKLEQNYRSTKTVLEAANSVIKNNLRRKDKRLWTEAEDGPKIKIYSAPTDIYEAQFVVSEIKKLHESGRYSDNAVLYRTNSQSRALEDQFFKQDVPYRIFGGTRFYQRKEVKDLLAYLRSVENPYDEVSLKRIINYPKRGIGDSTVDSISEYASSMDLSFYSALCISDEVIKNSAKVKKIGEFTSLIEKYTALAKTLKVGELVKQLIEETCIVNAVLADGSDDASDRAENINEFLNKAVEFENSSDTPYLSLFLEEVALVADIDNLDESVDAVVLMTIHSAKGLEFPNVFLTGVEEGIFPGMSSIMSPEALQMEEERRLCYVAVTRAKKQLYVTHAIERMRHGVTGYNSPSRFLKEIPRELVMPVDASGNEKTAASKTSDASGFARKGFMNFADNDLFPNKSAGKTRVDGYAKENRIISVPVQGVVLDFEVGDSVSQAKYGIGVVKDIRPAGADYEVTVEFPSAGIKKFMSNLAKLAKV